MKTDAKAVGTLLLEEQYLRILYIHIIYNIRIRMYVRAMYMHCTDNMETNWMRCQKNTQTKIRGRILRCPRMNLFACGKHSSEQISFLSVLYCMYACKHTITITLYTSDRRPTSKSKTDCFHSKQHANRHQYCLSILLFATHKINTRFHFHFIHCYAEEVINITTIVRPIENQSSVH